MNVIIANDTRTENHHGCSRVMNAIDRNLFYRNVEVLRYIKLLEEWNNNENVKRDLLRADLVIINGEGTIHDDNPYINCLLSLIEFCIHYDVPVVVINATISNLSEKNLNLLRQANTIYVRESCSYDYLAHYDIKSVVVPDLTFWEYNRFNYQTKSDASKIGYTDSVLKKSSIKIEAFSKVEGFEYIDIFNGNDSAYETIMAKKNTLRALKKTFVKEIKKKFIEKKRKKNGFYQKPNQVEFVTNFKKYKFIFTGRYHMVCFCLIMKIPFFAISSNTFKIEGLLLDVALNPERLVLPEEINSKKMFEFEPDEILNIEKFLIETNEKINDMFNHILSFSKKYIL